MTSLLALAATAVSAADSEAGKIKAITCTGCHGIANYNNVYPVYKVPKIGGQNEKYLISALQAYKNGDRNHLTMQAHAASLNQQDIADIAAWFASLK
ncbi:MAG: c-type cytochrome [Proteobacteria bacterium]|nr:c-type cytochrome [Pseudomonadota bacterium]